MHHLQVAGLDKQIFTDEAITMISQYSKGIPRRINNICRYAIVAAMTAESTIVDANAVQKGMSDEEFVRTNCQWRRFVIIGVVAVDDNLLVKQ